MHPAARSIGPARVKQSGGGIGAKRRAECRIETQVTFGACTHEGIDLLNARRAQSGLPALVTNPKAEAFACSWAQSA